METALVKETIEYLLDKLSVNAEFTGVVELDNGHITKFAIKTEDPHFLIGENGKILLAFNHVVKKIYEEQSRKKNLQPLNFIVDVNDYQEKRIQELHNKAHMMAERARFFKSNVELIPMNPYERMIVHSLFTDTPDIETESVGTGRARRVVIRYVEN